MIAYYKNEKRDFINELEQKRTNMIVTLPHELLDESNVRRMLVLIEYQRVRTRAAAAISIPAAPTPMAVIASIYDLSAMSLTF
jgi:hypothetical protein